MTREQIHNEIDDITALSDVGLIDHNEYVSKLADCNEALEQIAVQETLNEQREHS